MKELGEVSKRLQGADPQLYIPYARLMLGQMKERMKMLNLQQLQWQKILAGGVLVFVSSVFGQDTIQINVPPPPPVKDNPEKPIAKDTYTREITYPEDEFYYLVGANSTRDYFQAIDSNYAANLYSEANELYRYSNGEIKLIHTFDHIGRGHSYGIAVSDSLIMISYVSNDRITAKIEFYNKYSPDEALYSYSYYSGNDQIIAIVGKPVFHKKEFKVVVTLVSGKTFHIFDADGQHINEIPYDQAFNFAYLESADLTVNAKDELLLFHQDQSYRIPLAQAVWQIIQVTDDYQLGESLFIASPPIDALTPLMIDYGGFFSPTYVNGVAEGRFSYGKASKIAVSTNYTILTATNSGGSYYAWTAETYRKYQELLKSNPMEQILYYFLTHEVEYQLEEHPQYNYANIPLYFTITEIDSEGKTLHTLTVPSGGNYAATAVYSKMVKKIYTYQRVDGVDNLIAIDVYDVIDNAVDIFLYKEL